MFVDKTYSNNSTHFSSLGNIITGLSLPLDFEIKYQKLKLHALSEAFKRDYLYISNPTSSKIALHISISQS